MITPEIADALQEQMNVERFNSASYRALSLAMANANWPGTAKHFAAAAEDEQAHADKIAAYLIDHNTQPVYDELDGPELPTNDSILSAFTAAQGLEQATTTKVNALYWQAFDARDAATAVFLEWFVSEQVESEREYTDKVMEITRAQGNAAALLILDREYGK